ncbi:MAG: DUF3179 domain-containing (seleno)protein [Candidatus Krumholzibacteria bacterium]|nr:DUF3179 domain-containing (seleno)protein [Candidatus Krumholzibacteria bacterium]
MTRHDPASPPRRGLRGAWWIACLAIVFFAAAAAVQLGEVRRSRTQPRVGDGKDPATYGFDLANLTVPARWLAAAMPRDALAPLDHPPLLTASGVDSLNRAERGKYLVSDDLVIGVAAGGAARAYPLRVLNWHEVANDTVGGVPVAVAWHPLSGAAAVLGRRLGERTLVFGVSGLVWNSHHVLYDRRMAGPAAGPDAGDDTAASLWVPILARAVAGPAAGDTLAVIPAALVRWQQWRAAFPATTVPLPDRALRAAYKRDPYGSYQSGDVLRYPVAPLPALPEGQRLKDLLPLGPVEARAAGASAAEAAAGSPAFARAYAYRFLVLALDLK